MLVLFDVDGTMLTTHKAGSSAMMLAGERVYGRPFQHRTTRFAGNIDPCIWRELCAENGFHDGAEREQEFRAHFRQAMVERLAAVAPVTVMDGVFELLAAVEAHPVATLGLLTGNFPETGRLKLEAGGIDPDRFQVCAWGSDGSTRRELVPVALERFGQLGGRAPSPDETVVIGDTPADVDCARAHQCRVLAVATGPSSEAELHGAGADRVCADLTDTDGIMAWLEAVAFRTWPGPGYIRGMER